MLKLVEKSGDYKSSHSEILETIQLLSEASNLRDACEIAQDHLQQPEHELVSVIFCSNDDSVPAIRPFRNLPDSFLDLANKMQGLGGCPPRKEAQRLLRPFDWKSIEKSRYDDFLNQRFLAEVQKLDYAIILAVPVLIGCGTAVFSVGVHKGFCCENAREDIVSAVSQIAAAMISRFPELATMFEPKKLSTLQATVLLFSTQGLTHAEIAKSVGFGEMAVGLILKSAQERLGASNLAQAVAKALACGEISNMQIGEHDLV